MAYRTRNQPDRVKPMIAAIAATAALGVGIISGLSVREVTSAVDGLKTFSIAIPKPPPPPPPPPPPRPPPENRPQPAKHEQGTRAKQANPAPVVAPKTLVPRPSPIPAATVAGTGFASSAGAGGAANGTGPGSYGNGLGGGTGAFTPARKISKIPDLEYERFVALGIPSGVAGVTVRVNPDGSPSNCRVARSSGSLTADSLMCQLTLAYVRFSPALDPSGRPIAEDVTFFPNWRRR